MMFQVTSALLLLLASSWAVPLPRTSLSGFPSASRDKADEEVDVTEPLLDVTGYETMAIIGDSLPALSEALTDPEGRPIDKHNKITLAFLPISRRIIDQRAEKDPNFNKEAHLKRQEAAEKLVPNLLKAVAEFLDTMPSFATPAPIFLPPTTEFVLDNPNIPNETIKGFKIPPTAFSPAIKIPDVKVL